MEPPEIRKLDFSQFHPLDHTVWECTGYPGGRRRHLKFRWQFVWKDKLRAMTFCRVGRHSWAKWWDRQGNTGLHCVSCFKDKDLGVQKMIGILIAVYRANPFRPHCGSGRHVWLCRALGMSAPRLDGPRCGGFDG
jgi:hypothetical protein